MWINWLTLTGLAWITSSYSLPLIKPFRSHSKSMILRIILSFYIVFVNSFERTYEKLLAAERRLKAETSEPIFSCMKFTGGEHILKHNFYTNKFDTSGNILVPKCLWIKISHNPNSILRQLGTITMCFFTIWPGGPRRLPEETTLHAERGDAAGVAVQDGQGVGLVTDT